MAHPRHRTAPRRAWRALPAGMPRLALPALAVAATAGVLPLVQSGTDPVAADAPPSTTVSAEAPDLADRTSAVSRAGVREQVREARREKRHQQPGSTRMGDANEATVTDAFRREVVRARMLEATVLSPGKVDDVRWAGAPLNLWARPTEDSHQLAVLPEGSRLPTTGDHTKNWVELNWHGRSRWVNRDYVLLEKPKPPKPEPASNSTSTSSSSSSSSTTSSTTSSYGTSDAPCPDGSSVESGLSSDAVVLYRSVCAAFPELTTYGGYRADSIDHSSGTSIDFMIPSSSTGDAVAQYVMDHASELNINYIMWSQQIWSVDRSSEGWRYVEDRGSATANHFDHVHVTTY